MSDAPDYTTPYTAAEIDLMEAAFKADPGPWTPRNTRLLATIREKERFLSEEKDRSHMLDQEHARWKFRAVEAEAKLRELERDVVPRSRYDACNADWLEEKALRLKAEATLAEAIALIPQEVTSKTLMEAAKRANELREQVVYVDQLKAAVLEGMDAIVSLVGAHGEITAWAEWDACSLFVHNNSALVADAALAKNPRDGGFDSRSLAESRCEKAGSTPADSVQADGLDGSRGLTAGKDRQPHSAVPEIGGGGWPSSPEEREAIGDGLTPAAQQAGVRALRDPFWAGTDYARVCAIYKAMTAANKLHGVDTVKERP